jgi:hypothetical protein
VNLRKISVIRNPYVRTVKMRIRTLNEDKIEFDILYSQVDTYLQELKQDKDLMTKPNLYAFYGWLSSYKEIVEQGGTLLKVHRH